jgi:hypothetical protein
MCVAAAATTMKQNPSRGTCSMLYEGKLDVSVGEREETAAVVAAANSKSRRMTTELRPAASSCPFKRLPILIAGYLSLRSHSMPLH